MINFRKMAFAIVASAALALGSSVVSAAPAQAEESTYLELVTPRFAYLTTEQLRAEGYRVCAATRGGMNSMDAMGMVQKDLGVTVPTSIDIVVAAVVHLC